MKGTILLNYDANVKQVETEEKNRFLRNLLEQMGVPIQEFWETEDELSVENKIRLRNTLVAYNIQLLDDQDGELQVYLDGNKIAQWNKCTYKIKKDLGQLDRKKQLYLEMNIDYYSMLEET